MTRGNTVVRPNLFFFFACARSHRASLCSTQHFFFFVTLFLQFIHRFFMRYHFIRRALFDDSWTTFRALSNGAICAARWYTKYFDMFYLSAPVCPCKTWWEDYGTPTATSSTQRVLKAHWNYSQRIHTWNEILWLFDRTVFFFHGRSFAQSTPSFNPTIFFFFKMRIMRFFNVLF